jgi:ribosome-associated protein
MSFQQELSTKNWCDKMEEFKLENQEYIQLNQLLKATGLVGTGGEAMIRISEGEVFLNGTIETQKRKKIRVGDKVKYLENTILIIV